MPNPEECGDDLIVMCAYAYRLYHRELLIVSMGTCSVICHVNKHGRFKHCIIAPGFKIVCDTLWNSASMLNESIPEYKESYFANNTKDAISVGTYKGYVNMLESLIKGIKDELEEEPYIIGCGGMGKLLVPYINLFNEFNPDFVTEGLRYIGDRYGNNEDNTGF
jgi:pantothenate kinase, type III